MFGFSTQKDKRLHELQSNLGKAALNLLKVTRDFKLTQEQRTELYELADQLLEYSYQVPVAVSRNEPFETSIALLTKAAELLIRLNTS